MGEEVAEEKEREMCKAKEVISDVCDSEALRMLVPAKASAATRETISV